MNILIIIFFFSVLLILHTYVLYPVSIKFLALFYHKNYITDNAFKPQISILISAYNEAMVLEKTILNLFASEYPPDKLEIIVGSDNSTDDTNEILKKIGVKHKNLNYVIFHKRRGKKFVINDIVKLAKNEILVFCDSNTIYKKDALKNLVKYYADSRVGGVCGRLKLVESTRNYETGNQEKKYWHYESWIKNNEGKLGVLIGANGGIYSIKKNLFTTMPEMEPVVDDLYLSLKILEKGKDFIYTSESEAVETISPKVKSEFDRKVRIMPRNIETLKALKSLIFSKRFLVSYGLWSHKIIRWFSPILFILLFIMNIFLLQSASIFKILLFMQLLFYFFAVIGFILNRMNLKITLFLMIYYFFITNVALVVGLYKYVIKAHKSIWEPTPRS
ncbi:MAG: glycosyltransferase family 2 protein [Ignavibacteriales bacterium]|nr:glycosyltransferase family 2 protein [Ignavibacteriales bacterium]